MRKQVLRVALLATAVLVAAGGCASKGPPDAAKVERRMAAIKSAELALVDRTVASPDARESLRELFAERDRLVAEQAESVAAYREKMRELNADYDATPEMFAAAMSDYNRSRVAWQKEIVGVVEAMKRETTADEWRKIAKFELDKLNPREMAYAPAGGGR